MYATLEACFSGQNSRTDRSYITERLGWGVTSICSLWPCSAKNHLYDNHSPVGPRNVRPPGHPGNQGASPARQKLQSKDWMGKPGYQTCVKLPSGRHWHSAEWQRESLKIVLLSQTSAKYSDSPRWVINWKPVPQAADMIFNRPTLFTKTELLGPLPLAVPLRW